MPFNTTCKCKSIIVIFRYSINYDLGAYLVLGSLKNRSVLTSIEETAIKELDSAIDIQTIIVYYRVLHVAQGTLYGSTGYIRQIKRNDTILCLKQGTSKSFGVAQCFISYCTTSCSDCVKPCHHAVIIKLYDVVSEAISTDNITAATARHVHCVQFTR